MLKSMINPDLSGKHTKLILTFLFFTFLSTNLFAQFTQEWVSRYNGPGNGSDGANSIAVDDSGNVYVTGGSEGDYVTLKYNYAGVQQWASRYNGPGNSDDHANSIAVDDSGNVYVTGNSYYAGWFDFATIKYNTFGVQQWVQRYNGSGFPHDARSIALDNSGNVYVTGGSYVVETGTSFTTIKYSSAGVQLWVRRWVRTYGYTDYSWSNSIAVDSFGNVYVTGKSLDTNTLDYQTIKYSTSGVLQWVKIYDDWLHDVAHSIAVDGSGNVYVTGESWVSYSYYDYATIKYNWYGAQQWIKNYTGPGMAEDVASSIAVDGSGNVYVTGWSVGNGTGFDYATLKYNTNSAQQWVQRYNGPGNGDDKATSIAVDGFGNVYVTGNSVGNGTGSDYTTIKYNNNGVQLWISRYNGPGNGGDGASSLVLDGSGNVFVTGSSTGIGTSSDYATIKYSQPIPAAPVLVSPTNGAFLVVSNPLLDWDSSLIAEIYQVQVSTDSLLTSTVYDSSGITISEFQIPINGLNFNTTYYWRANATNVAGTSPWSTIFHFTIEIPTLTSFNLSLPPNGTKINTYPYKDTLVHMIWTRSGEGTTYKWKFGSPTIANPMFVFEANNSGYDSVFSIRNGSLDSILASLGVLPGDSIIGEWAVWAYNSIDSLKSTQTYSMILRRAFVLFYDPFSTGTSKWLITNNGGNCNWTIFSTPYPNNYTLPPTSSSPVLSADPDECGYGKSAITTATVVNNINCSGLENISLEFDNDWNARLVSTDSAIVEASYNGGTTWTPIILWGPTDVRNTHENKPLPGAANIPNLKVRFRTIQLNHHYAWSWWVIDNVIIKGDLLTGVAKNEGQIPTTYALSQNYPNPFNPSTKIKFDIPKSSYVKLIVYDVLGREIKILVNEKLNAGRYEVNWPAPTGDGMDYPSGVYFYKLIASDYVDVKKMLMIK